MKDIEKELVKTIGDLGLEFESYDEINKSDMLLNKILISDELVYINSGEGSDAYDLLDKDNKVDFVQDMIDILNNPNRYLNSNNKLLMYCDLYHKARVNNYGFSFESMSGAIMINGRLIIFYPMVEIESLTDFDRMRVVVYKSNNIRKKDIVFTEVSSDLFNLTDEVMKLCGV